MAGSLLGNTRPILLKFSESARYLIVHLHLDAHGQDNAQTCTTAAGLAYGRALPILVRTGKIKQIALAYRTSCPPEDSGICVASRALS